MRVYPGLTRVTSNNFDPIVFWKKGVQMVALNWQKYGIHLPLSESVLSIRSWDADSRGIVSD